MKVSSISAPHFYSSAVNAGRRSQAGSGHWQVIAKASRAALIEMTAASNVLSIRLGSAAACGEAEKTGEQGTESALLQ